MCGIFGSISTVGDSPKLTFGGLSDIEYRGYDSWGIASFVKNKFELKKEIGFLPKKLKLASSNISIGHTRWATHGGVTKENAHPHLDCSEKIALVHNGIVENYQELKKKLKSHKFKSQTDTEVIVHLIEERLKKDNDLARATAVVFKELNGLNGIVVTDGSSIVACKNSSPLVIGKTSSGFLIASDPNALLPHTKELLFLEDNHLVSLGDQIIQVNLNTERKVKPAFTIVDWKYSLADMKDFPHFMLKEMHEQPKVLRAILQNMPDIKRVSGEIKNAFGTYFIGCGTAAYACLLGTYLFSKIARKHVNFSIGSEFSYIEDYLTKKSLLIAVSQSGETIDIVEPVSAAKKKGAKIIALTNTLGSTLYRMANARIMLQAGPEKAVASTKAYIAMVGHIILLAYSLAGRAALGIKIIEQNAKEVERVLKQGIKIKELANKIHRSEHIFCIGRGVSYPVALESALKIKETSYIHTEGFASGELKHGAIALIEKGTPVIAYIPNDETKEAVLANAIEVKARGAFVIGVSPQNNSAFDCFFKVSDVGASSVIPNVVFAQLLGYFLAVKKGYNPDKPRNLAKSVVVR